MKNSYWILPLFILLSACIKEQFHMQKFGGEWEFKSYELTTYDTTGKTINVDEIAADGYLNLRHKDSLYSSVWMPELSPSGAFWVNTIGDQTVIYFFATLSNTANYSTKATVTKRSGNDLHITFYSVDDKGRLSTKKTYLLRFVRNIDYKKDGNNPGEGSGFKYIDKTDNLIVIPYYKHTYAVDDGNYKLTLEFFNNLGSPDYKYLKMSFKGDASSVHVGSYPYTVNYALSNAYSAVYFYDGGDNEAYYNFASNGSGNFNINSITLSGAAISISATCDKLKFLSVPLSLATEEMINPRIEL